MTGSVHADDLEECWCCGGLHDSVGTLCPSCDDAGCSRFDEECASDHQPVLPDGGKQADVSWWCEDCEQELALQYRPDRDGIVCGHCGGTNTRPRTEEDQHAA